MCNLSSFGRRRGRASILKSQQLQMYVVIKIDFRLNDKYETAKVLFEKFVMNQQINCFAQRLSRLIKAIFTSNFPISGEKKIIKRY